MIENSNTHQEVDQALAQWLGDLSDGSAPEETLAALDAIWAAEPPEAALEAMRGALDAWWAEQHAVVYYDWIDAPIGRVYAAITDRGVISVDFSLSDDLAYLQRIKEAHLPGSEIIAYHAPPRLTAVIRQLKEYFAGAREQFDFPLDLSHLTEFQQQVLDATRQVAPGEVVSYKEIARRIGKPRASRAVGNALGRNPIPIIIPCHRVIPQNGTLGGYSGGGGAKTKARLLELEGVLPGEGGLYATA